MRHAVSSTAAQFVTPDIQLYVLRSVRFLDIDGFRFSRFPGAAISCPPRRRRDNLPIRRKYYLGSCSAVIKYYNKQARHGEVSDGQSVLVARAAAPLGQAPVSQGPTAQVWEDFWDGGIPSNSLQFCGSWRRAMGSGVKDSENRAWTGRIEVSTGAANLVGELAACQ